MQPISTFPLASSLQLWPQTDNILQLLWWEVLQAFAGMWAISVLTDSYTLLWIKSKLKMDMETNYYKLLLLVII
jgi:hypothetical protein